MVVRQCLQQVSTDLGQYIPFILQKHVLAIFLTVLHTPHDVPRIGKHKGHDLSNNLHIPKLLLVYEQTEIHI